MATSFNRRILVVDDNPQIHLDYKKILDVEGDSEISEIERAFFAGDEYKPRIQTPKFDLDFAFQGQEALQRVSFSNSRGQNYAVAFVDMRMPPGWDGLQTIEKLWSVDPNLEVVICSAYSDFTWNEIIERLGVSDQLIVLKKPFDSIEVIQLAISLTQKWNLKQLAEGRRLEAEKAKLEADFANEAKTRFLSNMSHEMRTPLNGILGFAEILARTNQNHTEEQRNHLSIIRKSGEHLLELINGILDLSKVESGKLEIQLETFDPHNVISDVIELLHSRAETKDLNLVFGWTSERPEKIESDPQRFRQLLHNLVGNAIKFTERGQVLVNAHFDPNIDSAQLEVVVEDTGPGIKLEHQQSIFEPFVQADDSITRCYGGTGLGLAICSQIIDELGSDFKVESEFGVGSRFSFRLDCGDSYVLGCDADRTFDKSKPANSSLVDLSGLNILVVDDSKTNLQVVEGLLENEGATVELATNGLEAVEKAGKREYDLILMDVQMPFLDGLNATQMLRERGYAAPIFALTANAMKGYRDCCIAAGCDNYLTKPFDLDKLFSLMADQFSTT